MRQWLTTAAELAGAASISVAGFLIAAPVGFAVGGVLLIGIGYLGGGDG